jgi:hypothetical protein
MAFPFQPKQSLVIWVALRKQIFELGMKEAG